MKSRDKSIDMLRGICMLCVMMGHVGYIPDKVMRWFLPFYVPTFFFITGYLKHDLLKEGHFKYIIKRCKRLVVPYFFYSLLLLFFCIIIHHMRSEEIFFAIKGILYSRFCLYPDIQNVNNIFFFTVANSPLWFLTASFVSEIFFLYTFRRVRNNRKMALRSVLLLVTGLLMEQLKILLPWSTDTAMVGAALMAAGYCWKLVESRYSKRCTYYLLLLAYAIVAMINVNANMSVRFYGPYSLSIFLFFIGGIAGAVLMKKICDTIVGYEKADIIKSFFCLIGENSIVILAFHWFIFSISDIVVEKYGIPVVWTLGYSIIKIVIALIICICVAKGGSVLNCQTFQTSLRGCKIWLKKNTGQVRVYSALQTVLKNISNLWKVLR